MATIIRTAHIDADADIAWEALSDFGALHDRLVPGFVTNTRLGGPDTRAVTFDNGATARERMIGIDHEARRIAYTIIESRLNPTHHSASAQVFDADRGRSKVVWITDVLPDDIAPIIADMMDRGIAAMERTLGGSNG